MGKYDDLVFTIPQEESFWYGMVSPRGFLRGNRKLKSSNLTIDFTVLTKPQPMDIPHCHPLDEYILFTGANLNNFFDFDAILEFWIGDDPEKMEMVPITQSSIIRVPAGMYHAPTYFKRFVNPLSGSALYPHGDFRAIHRRKNEQGTFEYTITGEGIRPCEKDPTQKCTYCGKCFAERMQKFDQGEEALLEYIKPFYEMAEKNHTGNFDKFIYPFKPEYHDDPNFLNPRVGFRGVEEIEGATVCFMYDIIQRECTLGDMHMHYGVEEYLFFTGSDINNFFDFDAEIEIEMGDDPDHTETHIITEPTVIQITPGMWHGPVKFKKVGAPINYMPIFLNGKYGKIVREKGPSGTMIDVFKSGGIPE